MSDDGVRITVLVDNAKGGSGLRERWGLSLWIETPAARVLLDCSDSHAFLHNAQRLGISLEDADAVVLSHGHYDHGGGMDTLVDVVPSAPLVLHPAALAPRFSLGKTGKVKPVGLPDRSLTALHAAPARVVWALAPLEVAPGVWATGPVPRHHPLEETESTFFLDSWCTIRDHVVDDQAVWIETPAGVIIICGCAHSGVINTVSHVRQTVAHRQPPAQPGTASFDGSVRTAEDGLPAVRGLIGGLHLLHARGDRLRATADCLQALALELCAPCHCTGERATALLRERVPGAFAEVVTGSELRLAWSC